MGLCFCPSGNSPVGRTGVLLAEWHPLKTLTALKFHKKLLSFQESLWIKSGLGWPWLAALSHTIPQHPVVHVLVEKMGCN